MIFVAWNSLVRLPAGSDKRELVNISVKFIGAKIFHLIIFGHIPKWKMFRHIAEVRTDLARALPAKSLKTSFSLFQERARLNKKCTHQAAAPVIQGDSSNSKQLDTTTRLYYDIENQFSLLFENINNFTHDFN
ncbi:hypothetical protein LLQ46_04770 [Rouxiella badensis]|uniref:hypothetical protein n=1 Tax=Rouxiella badensis TaxID=1646377 RepID=UPI001B648E4F|nr:hypothetical protein [Rouxiella badensis]MCC3746153.1 hypothetical protein [Rouxiella badensis]